MTNGKRILSVTIKHEVDTDPDTSYLGEYDSKAKTDFAIDRRHTQDCEINNPQKFESIDEWSYWNGDAKSILERIRIFMESESSNFDHMSSPNGCHEDCEACAEESFYADAVDIVWELEKSAGECDCGRVHIDRNSYEYFNSASVDSHNTPEENRKYAWQDYERMEGLNNQQWYFLGIVAKATIQATFDGHNYTDTLTASCWRFESDMSKSDFAEEESNQLSELKAQLSEYGFSKRAISKAMQNVVEEN